MHKLKGKNPARCMSKRTRGKPCTLCEPTLYSYGVERWCEGGESLRPQVYDSLL